MKRVITLIFLLIFVFSVSSAYSYWIWTPKTGKWVNPKAAVKETPKEQLVFAKTFFDAKQYVDAKREFKKLLKAFPKSAEAAESQYYLGRIDEDQRNLYEAYLSYQRVIDKYPFSERIQEIIEREYKIADIFMSGEKRKAMGIVLPVENPAVEILTRVVENSTYGPLAAKAQYKLGLILKELTRYYEAEDAFNKVISNYPDSEWGQASKYQIATCRAAVSRGADYDQGATREAKEKFEEFVKEYPEAVLSPAAEKSIKELNEKEAEGNFTTARFYEKQKDYAAAKIYYEDIVDNYPQSSFAVKARERLDALQKLTEKKK